MRTKIRQIGRQGARKNWSKLEIARELMAVAPDLAPAILMDAGALQEAGELEQAEARFWSGLKLCPCCAEMYLLLGAVIQSLRPEDPTTAQLFVEGFWRHGMAEGIMPETAKFMGASGGASRRARRPAHLPAGRGTV